MNDKPQDASLPRLEFNVEATNFLIHIMKEKEIQSQFTCKNSKKGHVWVEVAEKLKARGYDFGVDGPKICNQKWRNLKKVYIAHLAKPGSIKAPYISDLEATFSTARELLQEQMQNQEQDQEDSDGGASYQSSDSQSQLVQLSDILKVIKQYDKDRQKRDKEKIEKEEERLARLENLLREQNVLVKELNKSVSELSKMIPRKRKREDEI